MKTDLAYKDADAISYQNALDKALALRRQLESWSVDAVAFMRLLDRDWIPMMCHDQVDDLNGLIEQLQNLAIANPVAEKGDPLNTHTGRV